MVAVDSTRGPEYSPPGWKRQNVTSVPIWVVFFHRLARLGMATRYSPEKSVVTVDLQGENEFYQDRFTGLKDCKSVMLIYSQQRRRTR